MRSHRWMGRSQPGFDSLQAGPPHVRSAFALAREAALGCGASAPRRARRCASAHHRRRSTCGPTRTWLASRLTLVALVRSPSSVLLLVVWRSSVCAERSQIDRTAAGSTANTQGGALAPHTSQPHQPRPLAVSVSILLRRSGVDWRSCDSHPALRLSGLFFFGAVLLSSSHARSDPATRPARQPSSQHACSARTGAAMRHSSFGPSIRPRPAAAAGVRMPASSSLHRRRSASTPAGRLRGGDHDDDGATGNLAATGAWRSRTGATDGADSDRNSDRSDQHRRRSSSSSCIRPASSSSSGGRDSSRLVRRRWLNRIGATSPG